MAGAGEAGGCAQRDEAEPARDEPRDTGRASLLAQALARGNMVKAWQRVKANKGSAGVDGRSIAETGQALVTDWPCIREALLAATYRPSPVRRATIAKSGGGQRELGIPTVVDRLIQQALLQVMQPLIDPTFSDHSYGMKNIGKPCTGELYARCAP